MRTDALFIGIEVDDDAARRPGLAAKLDEVCPVDIYAQGEGGGLRDRRGERRRVRALGITMRRAAEVVSRAGPQAVRQRRRL